MEWHPGFSIVVGVALLVVGFGLLFPVARALWRFTWGEIPAKEDAPVVGATAIMLALTLVGAAALLIGIWLAATEARGRMNSTRPKSDDEIGAREVVGLSQAIAEVVKGLGDTIAKLRGGGLIIFSGLVVLLSVAWIAQSAIEGASQPAPTSSATPSESAAPSSEASSSAPASGDDEPSNGPTDAPST